MADAAGPGFSRVEQPPGSQAPLVLKNFVFTENALIPQRQWVIGTFLQAGYATLLAGPGGTGKTAFCIAAALAFITGRRDLLQQHVFYTGKVLYLCLEDDAIELARRVQAACMEHGVDQDTVAGHLLVDTGDRPIVIAKVDEYGRFKVTIDVEEIVARCKEHEVGLLIIDPLVKAHAVNENDNQHVDGLIVICNRIAREAECAVLLTHHYRKGSDNGGRDAIRGGSALIDGARIVRTLIRMSASEAENFSIPEAGAFRFIRLDDAKANLAPMAEAAWFELASVEIGNPSDRYKSGDSVQVVKPWKPPGVTEQLDRATLAAIFADFRRGLGDDEWYARNPRAEDWAGEPLMRHAGMPKSRAQYLLKLWITNGVLVVETRRSAKRRRSIETVQVCEAKAGEVLDGCADAEPEADA